MPQKSLLSAFENPVISNTFEFWCHLRSDFFSRGNKPLSKQCWSSRNQKAREQNAEPLCRITKASFDLLISYTILSSWQLLLFFKLQIVALHLLFQRGQTDILSHLCLPLLQTVTHDFLAQFHIYHIPSAALLAAP